ncbi:acetyl-CoA synthetase [Komagataeibacter medellinensis]|uniref:Acetyl-CoA synthetase n=1 Tax=Komagataeibacter medellinensis TaxID=1177712 RepID=A0ABQ6VSE1_9PROT|nr:acetyl-CoA synthetase [Komagataeibacter medellinensis]
MPYRILAFACCDAIRKQSFLPVYSSLFPGRWMWAQPDRLRNRTMISMNYENSAFRSVPRIGAALPQQPRTAGKHRFRPLPVHGRRALNVSALCVDRHLGDCPDRAAVIIRTNAGEGAVCYRELHERVCRLANALKDQGVQRGDRVAIHLPLMVESVVALLACARIGAVHVVLDMELDAHSMAERLMECGAVAVLTGDGIGDASGSVPLKATLDSALEFAGTRVRAHLVLVTAINGAEITMTPGRDHYYNAMVDWYEPDFPPEAMCRDDPLFVLYSSGGRNGVCAVTHTVGDYRRMASDAMEMAYPYTDADVPSGLLSMAWNAGQTPLLMGLLAYGGTIVTTKEALLTLPS